MLQQIIDHEVAGEDQDGECLINFLCKFQESDDLLWVPSWMLMSQDCDNEHGKLYKIHLKFYCENNELYLKGLDEINTLVDQE